MNDYLIGVKAGTAMAKEEIDTIVRKGGELEDMLKEIQLAITRLELTASKIANRRPGQP